MAADSTSRTSVHSDRVQRPALQPGHVEQVADIAVQPLGLLADADQKIGPHVGLRLGSVVDQGGGRAQHGGQRRAQVVADRVQQGRAQLVGAAQGLGLDRRGGQFGPLQRHRALVEQGQQQRSSSASPVLTGELTPATPARPRRPCSGQKVQPTWGRVPVPAPAGSPLSQAQRAAAMAPVAERVSAGEPAAGRRSPSSGSSTMAAARRGGGLFGQGLGGVRLGGHAGEAAAGGQQGGDGGGAARGHRAWSRTRPVSQPVVTATAKNTAKVNRSAAWPIPKLKRGSRKKKL